MSKNSLFFGFFLVIFVAIIVAIVFYRKPVEPYQAVENFESCVSAGGKVMASYPRQCSLPNGKFFVEQIIETECLVNSDCRAGQSCVNYKCR